MHGPPTYVSICLAIYQAVQLSKRRHPTAIPKCTKTLPKDLQSRAKTRIWSPRAMQGHQKRTQEHVRVTKTINLRTQVRLRSSQKCQGAPRRAKGNPKGAQGRPRGSQRLPKGDQKGIQNGTQNGSRFLSRSRDPIFHKKVIWSMPVQSKSLRKKSDALPCGPILSPPSSRPPPFSQDKIPLQRPSL